MPAALLSVLLITVGPAAVVVAETKQKRERSIYRRVGMGLPREERMGMRSWWNTGSVEHGWLETF